MQELPTIFPSPKKIEFGEGYYKLPENAIRIDDSGMPMGNAVKVLQNPNFDDEEYELSIGDSGIVIVACNNKSVKLAFQTLRQILMQCKELPYLKIHDFPDLPVRGFMLDISRCKVPTMDTLLYLVDMLALFKFNRLELYTEHTFAFRNHPLVWGDSSPMTPKEYKMLEGLCQKTGIELVANINSLGHFDRWLRYEAYQPLAESKAPFTDPMGNVRPYPTTLCPDDKALNFIDSLYGEFLPLFTSDKVNIGCDEPWELGMGKSKEICEKIGKYKVYTNYLNKLNSLVKKYNKRAYFWADVLMNDKTSVNDIPADMTPILWGYEADSPFEEQCAYLKSLNRNFLVAPGTSCWNSFICRWQNAKTNIENACKNAKEYEAQGAILTNWGDNGNHQAFCGMYKQIALFAQCAWSDTPYSQDEVVDVASKLIFKDETKNFAKAIITLANSDPWSKQYSLHNKLFFGSPEEVKKLAEENSSALVKIIRACDDALNQLKMSRPMCADAQICFAEIGLAMDMIRWAVNRSVSDTKTETTPQQIGLKLIIGRFEQVWLARARVGGLYEASTRIRNIKKLA